VKVTLRCDLETYARHGLFERHNAYAGIELRNPDQLTGVMADFRPEAVVNAAGIVKQRSSACDSIPSLEINALLPHRLAVLCAATGARLIHLSTDCVFSGRKGNYREDDLPDAEDLYGRTKFLGEVRDGNCLTLRTSIIGRELARKKSLYEWFLAGEGRVAGFRNAIFSGFTTLEMARIIELLLVDHPGARGMYHVSSEPITKYDLLHLFREAVLKPVEIVPDDTLVCDRSLDSSRFRGEFRYTPPDWRTMITELAGETTC
jgi:dTDP-4-dehydrorhamnose reductase